MKKLVLFSHGKDSEPWGDKTMRLAEVAKAQGYEVDSIDYRSTVDPSERVSMLQAYDFSAYDKIILTGSSMGGYVSTVVSENLKPDGLFLLAPAFYLDGYPQTEFKPPEQTFVVHGWQDDIVPPEHAWRFCQHHHCRLQMLNAGHRLIEVLDEICEEFARFLAQF